MNPKFRLLLASLLLLSPLVHSCYFFYVFEPNSDGWIQGGISEDNKTVCSVKGFAGQDNLYHFVCNKSYAATFNAPESVVDYTTPHERFTFAAAVADDGGNLSWAECEKGCPPAYAGCPQGD